AGAGPGLGLERDNRRTRSGTFWPFWKLMRALVEAGRAPRTIVLENVPGCLTSHGGKDFAAIASALSDAGYRFGAVVINAAHFVPQSRARVFFVAIWQSESIHDSALTRSRQDEWRPASLLQAHAGMPETAKQNWVWWNLAKPPARAQAFADLIEDPPSGVEWHSPAHTNYLLQLMSPLNRQKVDDAIRSKSRAVGTIYRRTRPDDNCVGRQRAEVRFDDVAGCLRTPRGGSSRQTLLIVEDESVRSRLLSPREAARLMGLDDCYRLPARYNDAYHVCGDGVCVPVVRFIASRLLEPLLASNCSTELMAAE
ncbi:MAG TPA: DNA cytosine methyltransferase, partial [Roseiarcus sp.]|nr:DNA cytosine methyltransferase [Roseiarcus sp.]